MKALAFCDYFDSTLDRNVHRGEVYEVSDAHLDGLCYLGLADEFWEAKTNAD